MADHPSATKTDAATFEVVKNSLYAVAEEMKVVLAKTAYSPILKVAGDSAASAGEREREVVFGERLRCPVVARSDLPAGTEGRPGPFIVEEMDCTIAVPPGWRARRDGRGFILMTRSA